MVKLKSRYRFWLLMGVAFGLAFLLWRSYGGESKRPNAGIAAPPVRVARAVARDVPHYLNGLGTVVPSRDVLVQSRVDGQLLRIHFEEGQRVKAGDLLAEIDPRPFQAALDQAIGNLERDKAQLDNARRDLARYDKLRKGDYIAGQQYETQKSLARQYEGAVEADRAAVEAASLQLQYSRIEAPVSGRLGLRAVDEGNQIKAGDSGGIVRITETTPCDVVFTLPENQIGLVAGALREAGADPARAPIAAQAWDREQKLLLATGRLLSMDNQIDPATGTVRLKARFPNADDALYPNQFVNIRLLAQTLRDAVTVPAAAVQLGVNGPYCYVVEKVDGKDAHVARLRHVEAGIVDDENAQVIEKGIKPGEIVVVDGLDRLRDGLAVKVAATMP